MRSLKIACAMLMLGGCGTYVPSLQVWPGASEQLFVLAITESIKCELSAAITNVLNDDKEFAIENEQSRTAEWFETWGVQVALKLIIDEETTFNPSAVWLPTSEFTLSAGGSLSSNAIRTNKLNYFYSIDSLYDRSVALDQEADDHVRPCKSLTEFSGISKPPIIRSDLKIQESISTYILASGTGTITDPSQSIEKSQKNNFTHEIIFRLSASGNINPQWVLSESRINTGTRLLSANREREHNLIMTFGPLDEDSNLAQSAEQSFFASQINSELRRD